LCWKQNNEAYTGNTEKVNVSQNWVEFVERRSVLNMDIFICSKFCLPPRDNISENKINGNFDVFFLLLPRPRGS
jgi:hypothetical protein